MRPKRSRRRLSDRRSADHQRNALIEFDVTFLLMSGRGSMSYGLGEIETRVCSLQSLLVRRAPDTPRLRKQPL